MDDKDIWVLTECYDDFDHNGDYYIRAFIGKPSIRDLINSDEGINEPVAKRLIETGKSYIELVDFHWYDLIKQED